MVKYGIVYGYDMEVIEVEERTTDYGSLLDIAIDKMEEKGFNVFVTWEEIEKEEIGEDLYVTGGNHGLNLYHGGNFRIIEL